jgi:hypothetical protein
VTTHFVSHVVSLCPVLDVAVVMQGHGCLKLLPKCHVFLEICGEILTLILLDWLLLLNEARQEGFGCPPTHRPLHTCHGYMRIVSFHWSSVVAPFCLRFVLSVIWGPTVAPFCMKSGLSIAPIGVKALVVTEWAQQLCEGVN